VMYPATSSKPSQSQEVHQSLLEFASFMTNPLLGGVVPTRDFLTLREIVEDVDGNISMVSVPARGDLKAPVPGSIRGQVVEAYTTARRIGEARGPSEMCEAEMVTIADPCGGIPKWAINMSMSSVLKGSKAELERYLASLSLEERYVSHYHAFEGKLEVVPSPLLPEASPSPPAPHTHSNTSSPKAPLAELQTAGSTQAS